MIPKDLLKIHATTSAWFNKNEWFTVFNFLYSKAPQLVKAMEIIKMWKMKHPRLPAGIEGTHILLKVLNKSPENIEEYDLRILFSTAIMRFLNVCVTHDAVAGRFKKSARYHKIPLWIVEIRNEMAHGVNIPPLDLLKKACDYGCRWVYKNYWFPISRVLRDYSFETDAVPMNNEMSVFCSSSCHEDELKFLLDSFECIVLLQHPKFGVKTIKKIPDPESIKNLIRDLRSFKALSNITHSTKLSDLSKSLIYAFNGRLSMANKDTKLRTVDILLNGIGFLCDEDLQMQLFESTTLEILPWNYVSLWLELLQVFGKHSILDYLLTKLFNIMSDNNEKEDRKRMATLWVIEIAKALKKVQLCRIFYETKYHNAQIIQSNEISKFIIMETESAHPTLKHIMTFDPFINIPTMVTNFKIFSKTVLKAPNEYVRLCLPFILELNTPKLNSNLTTQLYQLIDIVTNPVEIENEESSSDENVCSLYELKKYINDKMRNFNKKNDDDLEMMDSDDNISMIDNTSVKNNSLKIYENNHWKMENNSLIENVNENNHWKMASEHLNFHNCPLGLLPWQDQNTNPQLQTFLQS